MDREQALEMAQMLAASYGVQLGDYLGGRAAAASPNASHWALFFKMIDGPPGCNWLFNLNDCGENQIMVAMLPGKHTASKPKARRWFRFSLRTMFVLVTVIGGTLGWIGYNLQWIRAREKGYVRLQEVSPDSFESSFEIPYMPAPWPLPWFGEKSVITRDWPVWLAESDPELKYLRKVFPELRLTPTPHPATSH